MTFRDAASRMNAVSYGQKPRSSSRREEISSSRRQGLLITGASSGIGRHLTEHFAAQGYHVFATGRRPRDLESLDTVENVQPLSLDVRDPGQVREAVAAVTAEDVDLVGLVHNAGVGWLAPLSTVWDDELYDMFDVNVFGPHRLTNALLGPLLEARGRIVLIGSQGGLLSSKYFGPYTMTKHALEAYRGALMRNSLPTVYALSS